MRNGILYGLLLMLVSFGTCYGQVMPAPDLNCVTNDGAVDSLTWEVPTDPCGGGFGAYYIIAEINNSGTWDTIDSITNPAVTFYLNANGGDYIQYYMASRFLCPGFTPECSDTIDNVNPVAPEIEYITVLPEGGIKIKWADGIEPETYGYVLFHYPNGNTGVAPFNLGTVFDTTYSEFLRILLLRPIQFLRSTVVETEGYRILIFTTLCISLLILMLVPNRLISPGPLMSDGPVYRNMPFM